MRPLGIAALEDKVVQHAVATVLEAIYEDDFLGFSYGFRPGRGPHDALDALWVGLHRKKVNWVIDADIRGFFDAMNHEWLLKFVEHRIADRRILRLIQKWLRAGVSEDGQWSKTVVGTPQGAVISPLLANVYLHYVLDLWVHQWRKTARDGRCHHRPLRGRLRPGVPAPSRGRAVPGRTPGTVGEVRPSPAPREDAADRVRAVRGLRRRERGARAAGVVRLPGFHAPLGA